MISVGRSVAAFFLMMAAAYLTVVALLPAAPVPDWRPSEASGSSAAARLSQEAQILVTRKPTETLQ